MFPERIVSPTHRQTAGRRMESGRLNTAYFIIHENRTNIQTTCAEVGDNNPVSGGDPSTAIATRCRQMCYFVAAKALGYSYGECIEIH